MHPLTAYRKRQSPPLTQGALAAKFGVARTTVARWETGTRKIDDKLVPLLSEETGISPSELRPDLARLMREGAQ
jgi:transcriptional regulator with XRE-family HTH domain